MPTVILAPALARWLTAVPASGTREKTIPVTGTTVRHALDALFAEFPALRGYVVDERGVLRHHVVAYVNGQPVREKAVLDDPVSPDGELYLFQALSGG